MPRLGCLVTACCSCLVMARYVNAAAGLSSHGAVVLFSHGYYMGRHVTGSKLPSSTVDCDYLDFPRYVSILIIDVPLYLSIMILSIFLYVGRL